MPYPANALYSSGYLPLHLQHHPYITFRASEDCKTRVYRDRGVCLTLYSEIERAPLKIYINTYINQFNDINVHLFKRTSLEGQAIPHCALVSAVHSHNSAHCHLGLGCTLKQLYTLSPWYLLYTQKSLYTLYKLSPLYLPYTHTILYTLKTLSTLSPLSLPYTHTTL